MRADNFNVKSLLKMAHSPIRNYAVPGLTSFLIGAPSPAGTMRLFVSEREHVEPIVPHSHRFDFQCWVLKGCVRNVLWQRCMHLGIDADWYRASTLSYKGAPGQYEKAEGERWKWQSVDKVYEPGQCYSMESKEVHSIYFSRGATVLFFEGPTVADTSTILEPDCGGETIPTFKVEPWMFNKSNPQETP